MLNRFNNNMKKIILKKGRDESLRRFHPWVFSGAVAKIEGAPEEGEIVSVFSHSGELLACGHYQIGSISVRVLSFDTSCMMPDFWENRIAAAHKARISMNLCGNSDTDCYRLIHGEGDNLPGLIVDIYGDVAVMQAHSAGMFKAREAIAKALKKVYGENLKAVYDKSAATAPFKAGLELNDGYILGESTGENVVLENGHKFIVNWEEGQKTGFFLDQRENRRIVGSYAQGRKVLNLFCYTGGFSIYAMAAGALSVDSVDSSKKAIEMVGRNMAENGFAEADQHSYCEDAIEYLKKCEEGKYDLIIVDPPAFAKHRGALDNALRAYRRLNASAISKVAPGGLIFTYSCSQVVDRNAFALAVFSAAAETGRNVRILARLCQGSDHPVNIYHPEGEYLKGLLLYVE